MSEQEQREKVLHKWQENPNLSHRAIAKELKISLSTVNDVIRRFRERLTTDRAPRTYRPGPSADTNLRKKIRTEFIKNPRMSVRDVAKKWDAQNPWCRK